MTHAALQDRSLLLQAIARGWCHPKNSHKVVDPDLAEAIADEISAALSAMEGEAVGWRSSLDPPASKPHQWSEPVAALTASGDVFRISYMRGDTPESGCWQRLRAMADLGPVGEQVVAWTHIPSVQETVDLATAPPPQQVVGECCTCSPIQAAHGHHFGCPALHVEDATHPTPSPGPQGGGDRAVYGSGYGYCPTCGAKGAMRERRPNGDDICANNHKYPSRDALATPPAHQPGEVVTDEMVATMFAVLDDPHNQWHTRAERGRAALTAALAPKEAGHD